MGVSVCPHVWLWCPGGWCWGVQTTLFMMLSGPNHAFHDRHSPPHSGSSTAEPPGTPEKNRKSKIHPRKGAGPLHAHLLPAFSTLLHPLPHCMGNRGMGSVQVVQRTPTLVLCPWCLRGAWDTGHSQKSAKPQQHIPGSSGVILGWDRMGTWGFCLPISPSLYLV